MNCFVVQMEYLHVFMIIGQVDFDKNWYICAMEVMIVNFFFVQFQLLHRKITLTYKNTV